MNKKALQLIVKTATLLVVLFLIVQLNRFAIGSDALQEWAARFGYIGIFVASMVSGFNILVPIPVAAFYPFFLDAGFSSFPLLLVISLGMLIGDMAGYLIGHTSRELLKEKKKENKIVTWLNRIHAVHPFAVMVALFIYAAFVPLPNELIVIPMAFMGYKLRYMAIALFFGNILFNTLVAIGIRSIV